MRSEPTKSAMKASAGWARMLSGVSFWTRRPSRKIAIRVAIFTASSMSWLTKITVFLSRAWTFMNSSWISSRLIGSIAPNGSSIRRTGGSAASARATPTRCCCPPESSFG